MRNPNEIVADALIAIQASPDLPALEQVKADYLGKSGQLTELLKSLGAMPADERKTAGARINAASRQHGLTYSVFMNGLSRAEIGIDRKVLSDIAIFDKDAFAKIVEQVKAKLAA